MDQALVMNHGPSGPPGSANVVLLRISRPTSLGLMVTEDIRVEGFFRAITSSWRTGPKPITFRS